MCQLNSYHNIQFIMHVLLALMVFLLLTETATAKPTIASSNISNLRHQNSVAFYTDTQFQGTKWVLNLGDTCVNLPGMLNDETSSVDAQGGCVILCEHTQCRGRCQNIEYFSSDLSRIGLNDIVSSVMPCSSS